MSLDWLFVTPGAPKRDAQSRIWPHCVGSWDAGARPWRGEPYSTVYEEEATDTIRRLESISAPRIDRLTSCLAGQPNVGKSTIFNALTGLNQHVGNWPGKTVEQKTGSSVYHGKHFAFVDLPGTYSLTANSVEERITRDYILHEHPDVVVAVVDAAIPERSLYLLAELLQLPPRSSLSEYDDVAAGIRWNRRYCRPRWAFR